jgi:hypothetical protein
MRTVKFRIKADKEVEIIHFNGKIVTGFVKNAKAVTIEWEINTIPTTAEINILINTTTLLASKTGQAVSMINTAGIIILDGRMKHRVQDIQTTIVNNATCQLQEVLANFSAENKISHSINNCKRQINDHDNGSITTIATTTAGGTGPKSDAQNAT